MDRPLTTHEKALDINLDSGWYGTFAEIGAGQEVGRWFFRVGGAAGTVAKTVSAYDKNVSDAIYGSAGRYVSSERLESMLALEYRLNIDRLSTDRGAETAFFAFADTVSAQNYLGTADCHGWMGIRYQAHPLAESSQILLHSRMLDRDALSQHEALGILGVNLVHGAARLSDDPSALIGALLDGLENHRIEISQVEFSGSIFRDVDHRLISLHLVEVGLSKAAMFSTTGEVLRPSEILYKRPVILQRGRFRPPTRVHADIQRRTHEAFAADPEVDADKIVSLLEIDLRELRNTKGDAVQDFKDRIRALSATGHSILVSDYMHNYLVAEHLARYSAAQIAMPIGAASFRSMTLSNQFENFEGGLLEAAGKLAAMKVRFYIYPNIDENTGERLDLEAINYPPESELLYRHMINQGLIQPLEGLPSNELRLDSNAILKMIQNADSEWEDHVEPSVADAIKADHLFGYPG